MELVERQQFNKGVELGLDLQSGLPKPIDRYTRLPLLMKILLGDELAPDQSEFIVDLFNRLDGQNMVTAGDVFDDLDKIRGAGELGPMGVGMLTGLFEL